MKLFKPDRKLLGRTPNENIREAMRAIHAIGQQGEIIHPFLPSIPALPVGLNPKTGMIATFKRPSSGVRFRNGYVLDWYDSDFEPVTIYRIRNATTKKTILSVAIKETK